MKENRPALIEMVNVIRMIAAAIGQDHVKVEEWCWRSLVLEMRTNPEVLAEDFLKSFERYLRRHFAIPHKKAKAMSKEEYERHVAPFRKKNTPVQIDTSQFRSSPAARKKLKKKYG